MSRAKWHWKENANNLRGYPIGGARQLPHWSFRKGFLRETQSKGFPLNAFFYPLFCRITEKGANCNIHVPNLAWGIMKAVNLRSVYTKMELHYSYYHTTQGFLRPGGALHPLGLVRRELPNKSRRERCC